MSGLFTPNIKTDVDAQERVRNWIAELRTGQYKQGFKYLRPSMGQYCCLGVACNLYDHKGWRDWGADDCLTFLVTNPDLNDEDSTYDSELELPTPVMNSLCLRTPCGDLDDEKFGAQHVSLAGENDRGAYFSDIANIIEAELKLALTTKEKRNGNQSIERA